MPSACVIVLDAVGAGELPDAADFGDEGSDTLGNVARAVGGLDLPTLEALGLGNVEPLDGCPPQPGAPAVAGQLLERSRGKDTTTGHWELMGIVTPQAMPTYPHGFPDEVIDPFMNQTGRGVLGNVPASGTEIIQELGEEHQRTGQVDRLHERRLGLPDRRARGDDPARGAVRRLPRRARHPDRQARGRARDRAAVRRASRATTCARRTATTSRSSRRGRTTCRSRARRGQKVYGVGKISDIFAGCDIDESFPTKSNVEGIQRTEELLRSDRRRPRVHEPRRDRHALGPPQRPGELPPVPAGLRPPPARPARRAAGRRPADPHLRPRLRPDDAVDRPLARARAAARLRPGPERGRTRATRAASSPTSARPCTRGSAAARCPAVLPGKPFLEP